MQTYGRLPTSFEVNQGQSDPQVKFLSRGSGYSLFLTSVEAVLALRPAIAPNPQQKSDRIRAALKPEVGPAQAPVVLRMKLIGSNSAPRLVGLGELPGKSNYFIGNDPKKWRTNVANYSRVRYENIYPGVDVIYYGRQGQLEYDFVVAPDAAPGAITLGFEGASGMAIDPQGNLVLSVGGGEVSLHKPVVYQEVAGSRREIHSGYVLKEGNRVGFVVAAYDAAKPLVTDPTLIYSTYLGGSGFDLGLGIAVDSSGNAYVTGLTQSMNFPTTAGASQTALNGIQNAFVTKFNATGSALVYSTYLGGNSGEIGFDIAVDSSGNAYVTGDTDSTNFPTTAGAFQTAIGGVIDAFVTKLNATGSALVYSTYLGGSDLDEGFGITVDSSGNAYVTGRADSTNFPTASPIQAALSGSRDAFVARLNAAGSALVYSTYLGGNGDELGFDIAVDSSGNAYVTGRTVSANFPTTAGAFQTAFGGGSEDAFVTKLNPSGSALAFSTYLGGSDSDEGQGIAVDSSGNAYVTGLAGFGFPTTIGAFQTAFSGSLEAFVTKLNATGSAQVYSTYLAGSSGEFGNAIAIDASGNAYVTGTTTSTDFPTASPFQAALGGIQDAFVTELNATGSALAYSTYLGGSARDSGNAIAIDASGNAYVAGDTPSTDFPTASPFQAASGGAGDAFVAKIAPSGSADLAVTKTSSPDPVNTGSNLTYTVMVSNGGPSGAAGVKLTDTLPVGVTFVSASPSGANCTRVGRVVTCDIGTITNGSNVTVTIVVTVTASAAASITNSASVTSVTGDPVAANNSTTVTTSVTSSGTPTADLTITKTDLPDPVNVNSNLTYTITVTNGGPATATNVSMNDTLPTGVTFVSLTPPVGWTCTTPAVGATGTVNCTNPSLAVSASAQFTLVVTPGPGAAFNTSNTATVSAVENDPDLTNNSSTTSTQVIPVVDVAVTKSGAPDPINLGAGDITYSLTVSNAGPSNASNVVLTDTLPASVTFVSVMPGGPVCTQMGGTVTCNIGTLVSGGMMAITIVVTPTAAGTLTNTASVTATETDPTPANNMATAMTTVNPSADLSVGKTGSPNPVTAGSNLTYTITVGNAGPSAAASVTLRDTLPAGTTFVSLTSPAGWTCTTPAVGAAGMVNCTIAALASGAPAATFTLVVTTTAAGNLNNTAMVTTTTNDPDNANNSATAATTVSPGMGTDFTVSAASVVNVQAGTMGSTTITLGAVGGTFNTPVMLTGSSTLLGPFTFSPNPATIGATSANVTMTFATGSQGHGLPDPAPGPYLWLLLAGAMLLSLAASPLTQRRPRYAALALGLLLLLASSQSACVEHPRQMLGPVTVTVTATAGNLSHSVTITVNVTK